MAPIAARDPLPATAIGPLLYTVLLARYKWTTLSAHVLSLKALNHISGSMKYGEPVYIYYIFNTAMASTLTQANEMNSNFAGQLRTEQLRDVWVHVTVCQDQSAR